MDTSWMERAECKKYPGQSLWFPKKQPGFMSQEARDICAACPVIDKCREYVMDIERRGWRHGNWAGMSERERQRFAVQQRQSRRSS
jgi:WhiB family redox-sensing transcriptional regulator